MKITAKSVQDFENQFRELLKHESAQDISVVYYFRLKNPIDRVLGNSDIIYIGQTTKSFAQRYGSNQNIGIEKDCFESFYGKAIEQYGPLRIETVKTCDPKRAEGEALKRYFDEHLEYPPLNRTIPKRVLRAENT